MMSRNEQLISLAHESFQKGDFSKLIATAEGILASTPEDGMAWFLKFHALSGLSTDELKEYVGIGPDKKTSVTAAIFLIAATSRIKTEIENLKIVYELLEDLRNRVERYLEKDRLCLACGGIGMCFKCDRKRCPACHGTGKCELCHGAGSCRACRGARFLTSLNRDCPFCEATGSCLHHTCFGSGKCTLCEGSGICPHCGGSLSCSLCDGTGTYDLYRRNMVDKFGGKRISVLTKASATREPVVELECILELVAIDPSHPENPMLLRDVGKLAENSGNLDVARRAYNEALKLRPEMKAFQSLVHGLHREK